MPKTPSKFDRIVLDEKGQAIVEYTLLVSLVTIGLIGIFATDVPGEFYNALRNMYLDLSSLLALPFP